MASFCGESVRRLPLEDLHELAERLLESLVASLIMNQISVPPFRGQTVNSFKGIMSCEN